MKVVWLAGFSILSLSAQDISHSSTLGADSVITSSGFTPLTSTLNIPLLGNCKIEIEPGISFSQHPNGISITTFDGRNIVLANGSNSLTIPSPAFIQTTESGLSFGGGSQRVNHLHIRRQQQDDADQNLKSMQEAARKLKSRQDVRPSAKQPGRFANSENPFATAEIFNKPAIQQLTHLSPVGF